MMVFILAPLGKLSDHGMAKLVRRISRAPTLESISCCPRPQKMSEGNTLFQFLSDVPFPHATAGG